MRVAERPLLVVAEAGEIDGRATDRAGDESDPRPHRTVGAWRLEREELGLVEELDHRGPPSLCASSASPSPSAPGGLLTLTQSTGFTLVPGRKEPAGRKPRGGRSHRRQTILAVEPCGRSV